jgi:hypothetical protein
MPTESLSPEERFTLRDLGRTVDLERVRLYCTAEGTSGLIRSLVLAASGGRAVALGNHVFLPDDCREDLPLLAHELTHCGQYQAWGPLRYFTEGATAQLRHLLHRTLRIGSNPYHYQSEPGKPFSAYGMEQQGQIVEDCFRGKPEARVLSPFRPESPPD